MHQQHELTLCRGYRSKITPWRPHVLCAMCARWHRDATGPLPVLSDNPDGTVECPVRIPLKTP